MSVIIFSLCALASIFVAYLLAKAYRQRPSQILFWSAICFGGLALNNIVLFIDLVLMPAEITYGLVRNGIIVASIGSLVYGLVWDTI